MRSIILQMRHRVIVAASILLLFPSGASAYIGHGCSIESIVDAAEIIVVGQVVELHDLGPVPTEETQWKTPLRRMEAAIRILRTHPIEKFESLAIGSVVSIQYLTRDRDQPGLVRAPIFPHLVVQDIYAFPLQKQDPSKGSGWELIHERDSGFLISGSEQPFRPIGQPISGEEFLRYETVGAFVHGNYQDISNAIPDIWHWRKLDDSTQLRKLLLDSIQDDTARWTQIALASYCTIARNNGPKLDSLPSTDEGVDERLNLMQLSLRMLPPNNSDILLIQAAVKHVQAYTFAMATVFSKNYSRHPEAIRLFLLALQHPTPEIGYITSRMIDGPNHPLTRATVRASMQMFDEEMEFPSAGSIASVCRTLLQFGSNEEKNRLLAIYRQAASENRDLYEGLWMGVETCGNLTEQLLPFYADALRDKSLYLRGHVPLRGRRICDSAAGVLQFRSEVDFGYNYRQSESERDQAIERAKKWLAARSEN